MKVNRVERAKVEGVKQNKQTTSADISFRELMSDKRDSRAHERLSTMLEGIKDQGKVLSEKKTVDNLMKYKKMVKEFLNEAVEHGLNLEKRGGFRRGGRSRILKLVSQVDKKLLEVTDAVINDEKKGLNVLTLVGEIEGLLINIYA